MVEGEASNPAQIELSNDRMKWKRVILVAGHPRGGTTWVGKTLGYAANCFYINEPLTYRFHRETGYETALSGYFACDWWRFGGSGRELPELEKAFHGHIHALTSECKNQDQTVLVIKAPETEALEFYARLLQPDLIIYVKRSPMAILNSYHKDWLYRGWHVEYDWKKMVRDTDPDILDIVSRLGAVRWRGESQHVLGMAVLRYALVDKLRLNNLQVVDYETVASDPLREFRDLFVLAGLAWEQSVENKVRRYVVENGDEAGFDSVNKNSIARIQGWRSELPFWEITGGLRFLRVLGCNQTIENIELDRKSVVHGLRTWLIRGASRAYIWARAMLGNAKAALG